MFPSSVDTALELLDARNNRNVTLTAPINDSVTTIPVADTSLIPTAGYVTAEDGSNEVIHYTGVTPSSLTGCTRGADGTTASSHGNGGTLGMWGNAAYHNLLAQQLIAVEQNISDRIGLHASQVILQANLNANSFKLTGLAAGSGAGDSVRYEQVLLLSGGTLTGTLLLPDGTVGSPSLSFSADTDTGIFRGGANRINLVTGGTSRLILDDSGFMNLVGVDVYIASTKKLFLDGGGDSYLIESSANQIDIYTGGSQRFAVAASGLLTSLGKHEFADGSVSLPSISFSSDPDTGIYHGVTANEFNFATGGVERMRLKNAGLEIRSGVIENLDGTQALPAYSFSGETATGMYRSTTNQIGFSVNNSTRMRLGPSALTVAFNILPDATASLRDIGDTSQYWQRIYMAADTAALPSYSFGADTNTGMYSPGADSIGFSTNGVLRVTIDNSGLTVNSGTLAGTFTFADGSVSSPSITFGSDLNTGFYKFGSDVIGGTANGVRSLLISEFGISVGKNGAILSAGFIADFRDDTAAQETAIRFINNDNTSGVSNCRISIATGGSSGGDAYISITAQDTTGWGIGIDNSDSDKLKFYTMTPTSAQSPSVGTLAMVIDTSRRIAIGTANPGSYNANADDFVVANPAGVVGITLRSNTNSSCVLGFTDAEGTTIQGLIQYDHNATAVAERMTIRVGGTDVGVICGGGIRAIQTSSFTASDGTNSFTVGTIEMNVLLIANGHALIFLSGQFTTGGTVTGSQLHIGGIGTIGSNYNLVNAGTITGYAHGLVTTNAGGDPRALLSPTITSTSTIRTQRANGAAWSASTVYNFHLTVYAQIA